MAISTKKWTQKVIKCTTSVLYQEKWINFHPCTSESSEPQASESYSRPAQRKFACFSK